MESKDREQLNFSGFYRREKFNDEYNRDRSTVNMRRFINETPDDVLKELANYAIDDQISLEQSTKENK